jgi:hypothetical protein
MIGMIAHGRRWLDEIMTGSITDAAQLARREQCTERQINLTLSLAFLSPQLVKASAPCHPALRARAQNGARRSGQHRPRARRARQPCQRRCGRRCLGHQGVVVTRELLQRVAAMPPTRKYTAWGFRRRAALASFLIPREQQCYPRSVLPASKFEQGGESR